MSEDQPPESHAKWWPGRTSTIISAALVTLACPFLAFATWGILTALLTHVPVARPGAPKDEDAGLGLAVAYIAGFISLTFAGLLLMSAAGLFLRPGFRGRVIGIIATLIVVLPVGTTLALRIK